MVATASAVEQLGSQLAEPLATSEAASAHRLYLLRAPPGLSLRSRLPQVGPFFFTSALRASRPPRVDPNAPSPSTDTIALALAPSTSVAQEDPLRALSDLLNTQIPVRVSYRNFLRLLHFFNYDIRSNKNHLEFRIVC